MPKNKSLAYAEDVLGVHKVYEELDELLVRYDDLGADLDKAQDQRRRIEDAIADREVELIGEMRAVHPSMTDTRFKSEIRIWEREDEQLSELRSELIAVRSEIGSREHGVEVIRLRIKAVTARVEQLGGYLHFLAAVRNQAEKTTDEKRDA